MSIQQQDMDFPQPGALIRFDDMDRTMNFEGWRDYIYDDKTGKAVKGKKKGKKTIGWGFNIDDPTVASSLPSDVLAGKRALTKREASPIFSKLYIRARNEANNIIGDEAFNQLPEDVKYAMTDMSYNLGSNKFRGFKNMIVAAQNKNYETMAKEMKNSNWYKQVGNRSKTLIEMVKNANRQVKGY